MYIWLRLSATFHEHPKMLAVRKSAGARADSAELGWYRILMAAKRYGRWTFASEAHLEHVAGPFYRFVRLYRVHGLLDDLTVHDGDSYNAVKSDAERQAEKRERDRASQSYVTTPRDMPRDENVTLHTERDREITERESAPEGEALTWLAKHGCYVKPGNGYHRHLVTAVERHGINAIIGKFDRLAEAGTKDGDMQGFVFGAIDALNSGTRPDLREVAAADREEERRSSLSRRMEATQVRLHDNGAHFEEPSASCPRCKEAKVST